MGVELNDGSLEAEEGSMDWSQMFRGGGGLGMQTHGGPPMGRPAGGYAPGGGGPANPFGGGGGMGGVGFSERESPFSGGGGGGGGFWDWIKNNPEFALGAVGIAGDLYGTHQAGKAQDRALDQNQSRIELDREEQERRARNEREERQRKARAFERISERRGWT